MVSVKVPFLNILDKKGDLREKIENKM